MADIFISYSRRNLDFVQNLTNRLTEKGKSPWFDQIKQPLEGIPAGSKWWEEITYGIETTDTFLFIASPDSIVSPYCHAEIAHAHLYSKRIIPVLYCGQKNEAETWTAIDSAIDGIANDAELPDSVTASVLNLKTLVRENWLALSAIQHIIFSDSIPLAQSFEQLLQALDLDLAWVKMHSQLRQAAQLWVSNNRSDGYLWSAERLKPVHEMIERRKPELDPVVQDFIEPEQTRLLRELDDINTSHQRRRFIGERLEAIGDPRPGLGVIILSPALLMERESARAVPDILWCPVPAPPGAQIQIEDENKRVYTFPIQPFYIAQYLVTYRQFQAFLDASDGFKDQRWWRGFPASYVRKEVRAAIAQYANYPRDQVSWDHALTFTRWLDHRYRQFGFFEHMRVLSVEAQPSEASRRGAAPISDGLQTIQLNPDDYQLRLPTEWEWQWAAQNGAEAREYPWGAWDEYPRANTIEVGINLHSTAVGIYPRGAAACGALDMSGNLWEWCLNNQQNIQSLSLGHGSAATRGGSYNSFRNMAASAYRLHRVSLLNRDYGFRVVCAPPISL